MDAAPLLRRTRISRGLTQTEMARRAGTSQPVISAYEHGRRDPTTMTLKRLVAAAGAELELSLAPVDPAIAPPLTLHEHARRLVDVLLLADAIPTRPRGPLVMPRMSSSR